MRKIRIDKLNSFMNSELFLTATFDEVISSQHSADLLEDLLFLIGYNYINSVVDNDVLCFFGGVVPEDMRELLRVDGDDLSGSLSNVVIMVFNTLVDIKRQSNILDLYPRDMRDKINNKVIKDNGIDPFLFNQIQVRAIC